MTTSERKLRARIAELEERERLLIQDNVILEQAAYVYRLVLEHYLTMAVAAGADPAPAAEALSRFPRRISRSVPAPLRVVR